jgi:riboflavin synthase
MFTGLVLEMGEIALIQQSSSGATLSLFAGNVSAAADIGDSIAVNGVCLTVVTKKDKALSFDVSNETIRSTNLETLKPGDRVNLEPALRPDSKIGGHFVTGHVDAVGKISSRVSLGEMWKFEIEAPPHVMHYIVVKGSVAVDGISLTVVDVREKRFSLVIIPHTAKMTTMGFKGPGDSVNIETDILGKYVAKFLHKEETKDSRFMETLAKGGFLNR